MYIYVYIKSSNFQTGWETAADIQMQAPTVEGPL